MAYKNRDDQNAAWRRWYSANRSRKIAWQERRRHENFAWLTRQKLRCARCAETHPGCLTFHHRDRRTKEGSLATAVRSWSLARIEAEIAKCDVLCANCHAKVHWQDRNGA